MKPTGSAQTRALCYTQVLKSVKRVLPLTFFVFPAVSAHAFRAFDCDLMDDGMSYMRADYKVDALSKTILLTQMPNALILYRSRLLRF